MQFHVFTKAVALRSEMCCRHLNNKDTVYLNSQFLRKNEKGDKVMAITNDRKNGVKN
jgi:hypothetical protein